MTQIITNDLYIIVNKEDWDNYEYGNFPQYSFTSILEAVESARVGQIVVTFSDFLSRMRERDHIVDIGAF